jgi:general secretion pathway protein E
VLANDIGLKWQCLKCSLFFPDAEAVIHNVNSYVLNEISRNRIAFDMGSKRRLVDFLRGQGYETFQAARVTSKAGSGAAHVLDIMARRDDGFLEFVIGVGVAFARDSEEVGLEDVFRFDNKVYDLGIHDKVMLAMPSLNGEARQFARRQRIKAFDTKDLGDFLDGVQNIAPRPVTPLSFKFETRVKFLEYLHKQGYRTEEKARIPGRSGAEYIVDVVAYFDDGLFTHTISVGILSNPAGVGLEAVSAYDTKAYDIGIHDKVLLAWPVLTQEAMLFAGQQKIKVIEVADEAALA